MESNVFNAQVTVDLTQLKKQNEELKKKVIKLEQTFEKVSNRVAELEKGAHRNG